MKKYKELVNKIYNAEKENNGWLYRSYENEKQFLDDVLNMTNSEDITNLINFYKSAIKLSEGRESTGYMIELISFLEHQ